MTGVASATRQRLSDTFAALCAIESPSGRERRCADEVASRLGALGLTVDEDDAGRALGGDCGNLLTRIPGSGEQWLLLCAHLDTVPPTAPIEPIVTDGVWRNAQPGILGADNKVALAVLLTLAEALVAAAPTVGVELLFTVAEERALAGAKAFDAHSLHSPIGYVFDSAAPVGGYVVASPTYIQIVAELRGVAAHAGVRPEDGRSAILAAARAIARMPLGRLDESTTANVGLIDGGSAANVVPAYCRLVAEARSADGARAEQLASELVAALTDAANDPECECDLDVSLERQFEGYQIAPGAPELALAQRAIRACGREPHPLRSGGGSDANALRAKGIAVLNLANGTEHSHTPQERVSVSSLDGVYELAAAIVQAAGA